MPAAEMELEKLRAWRTRPNRSHAIAGTLATIRTSLRRQSRRFDGLVNAWEDLLPQELARHTEIVAFRSGVLDVVADGSPVAYQVNRLLRSGLLPAMQRSCKGTLRKIRVRAR